MAENKEEYQDSSGLEQGTYEIIRGRLTKYAGELTGKLSVLNEQRKQVFGAVATELVATEHITTEHACEARDMVPVGNQFIFGYNVRLGLKKEVEIGDVFNVYSYDENSFKEQGIGLLDDSTFLTDFKNLYKYYRDAKFLRFDQKNGFLYLVFQIGKEVDDIKTFKWELTADNKLRYSDSRSEHEVRQPKQFGFDWKKPKSDDFRDGRHPHVSIEDIVYVETVGGGLTIKVEDNTETGQGIYEEEVDHHDQNLNDAEIAYAIIGQIVVLRIRPYQEKKDRYFVYNHKLKSVMRNDSLSQACVLLPEDQGILFPQGYHLQSGESKLFDFPYDGMEFEKTISAPNGEDYLYVFYNKESGAYTLLIYNIIEQQLVQPIHCNGYSIFDSGELCLFRDDVEAKRHHSIQIWKSPFSHSDQSSTTQKESYLYKIGNKQVVKAMAECRTVIKLIQRDDPYETLYVDLSRDSRNILDAYHWINHKEAQELATPLENIESTAKSAIAEFDKVLNLKKTAQEKINELQEQFENTRQRSKSASYDSIERYVDTLSQLRSLRGSLISAKELRYIDVEQLDIIESELLGLQDEYANRCVEFLLTDEALVPYEQKVDAIENRLSEVKKVVEADQLDEDISTVSTELELLIEIVNSLNIEDSTVTTKIINNITDIFYRFNRIIADLKKVRKSIFGDEAESEFKSQLKLIQQGASNYINLSDTPDKSDDYLTRLIIQLEELEGKFSDFPEFTEPLMEVRQEIHDAFETHKLQMLESRNNRSVAIHRSCERILEGVKNRLKQFKIADEINSYLASDMLIQKVRDNIEKLIELDDTVKADELNSQLKTIREEAIRQLRDKTELFANGDNIIQLGQHAFSVNTKRLDVTIVKRSDNMAFHLTGTNFFETINNEAFNAYQHFWERSLISENSEVYRAEYLAYLIDQELQSNGQLTTEDEVHENELISRMKSEELQGLVQKFMARRYEERYVKGVHDSDASKILSSILEVREKADLLVFDSDVRAKARFNWEYQFSDELRIKWNNRLKAYGILRLAFQESDVPEEIQSELVDLMPNESKSTEIADYLYFELSRGDKFVLSEKASNLLTSFKKWLKSEKLEKKLKDSIQQLSETPAHQFDLIKDWLHSFVQQSGEKEMESFIAEAGISFLIGKSDQEQLVKADTHFELDGMIGEHSSIKDGKIIFDFNSFMERLSNFSNQDVPEFRKYQALKNELTQNFKKEIKLDSFEPKIMSSFVRNKLINEVYFPLIGNNMAKQIGIAGSEKRTDLMGMLLLISPPGYGKTTLMEYIAQRLGLIFVKINGPTLGHEVTSVDPKSAPNSASAEELKRLNLAFEMGDNVMIYIDDIQHCNPEFLQKFISLCDAQRKIEGVYNGESKTYDFRGRKVMVVMAGNPYTESGERFQIPDMLANRSDIYNLGDVIGDKQDVFELSYIENCLTSNSILQKLSSSALDDVYELLRGIQSDEQQSLNLKGNHSPEEIADYTNLLKRVLAVQQVVFQVNLEYIKSASIENAYRVAPPFKLQGSYRDMNKIVEKLVPVMNDQELETLILSHYENESQTLASAAESSLLRFKELLDKASEEEINRWNDIKETYVRNQKLGGLGDSKMAYVLEQMEAISRSLGVISDKFKN